MLVPLERLSLAIGGEVFKGLSISCSCSSHFSSCGVYGEVVLSSMGTPCATLPISPEAAAKLEFLLASSRWVALKVLNQLALCHVFHGHMRYAGTTRISVELKKANDI